VQHHLSRLLLACAAGLLSASTLLVNPPAAAASCTPPARGAGYAWMGVSETMSGARAVYSEIKTYDPFVGGSGFSYAWVMLPGSGSNQWAQIGSYKSAAGRTTTAQFMQQSFAYAIQYDWPAKTVGSVHSYSVGRDPATHVFQAYVDGSSVKSITLDWTPNGAQIYSEITPLSNQLMGEASNHETFGNNQIMNASAQWQTFAGQVSTPTTSFGSNGSAISFGTWDLCK